MFHTLMCPQTTNSTLISECKMKQAHLWFLHEGGRVTRMDAVLCLFTSWGGGIEMPDESEIKGTL